MLLNKKKFRFVQKVITSWEHENVITTDEADKLRANIELAKFDWNSLAKYSFWIAGISLAIAIFSIVFDEAVLGIIIQLLAMPDISRSMLFAVVSAGFYYWGFREKRTKPTKSFSNEFLLFIGAILTGVALVFFGRAVDTGSSQFSLIILTASLIYLVIGGTFPSSLMWVLGLIAFGSWFGTVTGYISGWEAYFLRMNYPLRFVFLGIFVIAGGFFLKQTRITKLSKPTSVMGLLYLFTSLWLLSIFGNNSSWYVASRFELFCWSFLFGITAIGAIIWGLKTDDPTMRKFGVSFLFINLCTRYFECFWHVTHKAVFFVFLAISFWIIGRYSEKIWNLIKERVFDDEG